MIYSPLEQFTIIPIINISNISINLIYLVIILWLLMNLNKFLLQKHIEWFYSNMNILHKNIWILFTIWLLILLSNMIGMIPYNITLTAQVIFVWSISLILFISINLTGLNLHKFYIGFIFLPTGVPLGLIPLIAFLEFFLYFIKVISLTLRLTANMVAGHILIKILIYSMINMPLISIFLLPILFLELLVGFLQAYVYITLTLSYYNDIIIPH